MQWSWKVATSAQWYYRGGSQIFLTASAETRAMRRNDQNIAGGGPDDYEAVLADVRRRDHLDSTRAVSPLRAAEDAVVVDTSEMTQVEVVARLRELAAERMGRNDERRRHMVGRAVGIRRRAVRRRWR